MKAWISLPARLASVEAARQWLNQQLDDARAAMGSRMRIELVLEELVMNIVRHGDPRPAPLAGRSFRLGLEIGADVLHLCLEDDGVPFDPTNAVTPPAAHSLAQARIGGLGLVLVRKSATSLRYERSEGLNRLFVAMPMPQAERDAG